MGQLRAAFIPPVGCRLVIVDYAQLEIVILAHLIAALFGPEDPLVQKVRRKEDIHGPLARRMFGELAGDPMVSGAPVPDVKTVGVFKVLRNLAKSGIYGNNYGKQDFSSPAGRVGAGSSPLAVVDSGPARHLPRPSACSGDWCGSSSDTRTSSATISSCTNPSLQPVFSVISSSLPSTQINSKQA